MRVGVLSAFLALTVAVKGAEAPGIDVFLYDGAETKQLTSGPFAGNGGETQINDKGWVVWSGGSGTTTGSPPDQRVFG